MCAGDEEKIEYLQNVNSETVIRCGCLTAISTDMHIGFYVEFYYTLTLTAKSKLPYHLSSI